MKRKIYTAFEEINDNEYKHPSDIIKHIEFNLKWVLKDLKRLKKNLK